MQRTFLLLFSIITFCSKIFSQIVLTEDSISFENPKKYIVGGITVSGVNYIDKTLLISIGGIMVGEEIMVPGDAIAKAARNLWEQKMFSDIKINVDKIIDGKIFLNYELEERPRLSKFSFSGIKKNERDDLREKIKLIKGKILTEEIITSTKKSIQNYFTDKGYLDVNIEVNELPDTLLKNHVILKFHIEKNRRVKIGEIVFDGNENLSDKQLRRSMKNTKIKTWWNIFTASKFIKEGKKSYEEDKIALIEKYNSKGYRDAKIISDSIYRINDKRIGIKITIDEGKKYYFRNITFLGNSKYSSTYLSNILGIKKGDVFNQELLDKATQMNPNGRDISSLYQDDGYLFSQVLPVEVLVENDSIDIEIRIYEGKQATINKVIVSGNTKTSDHVIMRELRTKPGDLYNRSEIIRTQRELSQLGYFDPEKIGITPKPNIGEGTVDIHYSLEEKASDQLEMSGGWGGSVYGGVGGFIGSLGVSFNNFSSKKFFNLKEWRPLPAGDGQKLSLRFQSTGIRFQSYNISFTEPWLGGKKPNSLSVSLYHSFQNPYGLKRDDPNRQTIATNGVAVSLGKRLKFPDDYFTVLYSLSYQQYVLDNYAVFGNAFKTGKSNNISFTTVLSRNSIDNPIYPRFGSQISLSGQTTLPYSLFNKNIDYSKWSAAELNKFVEFFKVKFTADWYSRIVENLVLHSRANFGVLGVYTESKGITPFERFWLGGSGMFNFSLDGREIVALRGYKDNSLTPGYTINQPVGAPIYSKYAFELRYPVSLNPMATVFGMLFAEAGKAWSSAKQFNPFDVYRSAGAGVRVFLPQFGMLGFDWGYGFDKVDGTDNYSKGNFHFVIGQQF